MVKYFQMEMIVVIFLELWVSIFVSNKMITVGIFGFIDSDLRWVNISDGSSLGPG